LRVANHLVIYKRRTVGSDLKYDVL
jgi:hypothetical protein